ncbi:dihydrofolate reductase family protein [Pseudoroseomonas globiformis]|uniref:Dihydrofolate reductase family protein n=1 Tax=Teichococcus globiformis TaxID=2307229 RepID=A0ABV7FU31_9PROT
MRKLITAAFISLDGVMQAPGGPEEDPSRGFAFGGWTAPYWNEPAGQEKLGAFMGEIFTPPFDLLLGRRTWEIFAAHWPHVGNDDPMGAMLTRATKYVATRSPQRLTWTNSVALSGDPVVEVAKLKQQDGPVLLTQGSSELVHALLQHDLIDELRLLTFPVILGRGKRLFTEAAAPCSLSLTRAEVGPTGVVMTVHKRRGAIQTGSFAMDEPSAEELARRASLAGEG